MNALVRAPGYLRRGASGEGNSFLSITVILSSAECKNYKNKVYGNWSRSAFNTVNGQKEFPRPDVMFTPKIPVKLIP